MKKLLLIGFALLYLVGLSYSQNDTLYGFYYANGIRHYWTEDHTSLNLIVKNLNHYDSIAARLGRIFNGSQDEIWADGEDNNIIVNSGSLASRSVSEIVSLISLSGDDIAFTSYAKQINGNPIWLTNEAYVKLKSSSYYATHIQPTLLQYPNVVSYYEGDNEYRFVCPTDSMVVTLANKLYDTAYVVYSSPDFYSLGVLHTNDYYFDRQWNLKNTGQNGGTMGVDIKAEEAWAFVQKVIGAPGGNVKVAVIDDGVEEHDDFYEGGGVCVVLDGYTANGIGTGRPLSNNKHGECCAGIIAAVHNNIGVAGVAPHSRIVPIRICRNVGNGSYFLFFPKRKIARAITKSWEDYDASILSCSWGNVSSDYVDNALISASSEGRNGKGCIVVFSSGNEGANTVNRPSDLNQVLCIGSINSQGQKLSDSNYGEKLDLVAPGENIVTTDRMGNYGYCDNQSEDPNYIAIFGKTSAACPHVSGVAALMLSVNPNLTREQVYAILESTAQKVGSYSYTNHNNHPNGTWNQHTGYGLVDAHMAVVNSFLFGNDVSVNGPASFSWDPCEEYSYTLNIPHPEYFTYSWSCSSNLVVLSTNLNSISVMAVANGTGYVCVEVYSEGRRIGVYSKDLTTTTSYNSTGTSPISVTSNTTWSGNNRAVLNDVVIEPGATLTITGSVYCSEQGCFKVKPQGRLVVDGGHLTSLCSEEMWSGIEVWGNNSANQYPVNGVYAQGYLELKNGAVVENADCAVELCRPGYAGTTGGIVIASDAAFLNNTLSVHAANYTNHHPTSGAEVPYVAVFQNCSFTLDDDYLGTKEFDEHVSLDHVNGVSFKGCSFSVDPDAPNVSSTNHGITAYNAGFNVSAFCDYNDGNMQFKVCPDEYLVHSSFSGFHDAINTSSDGSSARPFNVTSSVFSRNDRGVFAQNTGYATILQNEFNVGSKADCSYGVYAKSVTGFCIEENDFTSLDAKSVNFGIGVFGCSADNDVYLNTFDGLDCGNIAVGRNTAVISGPPVDLPMSGLTYSCNQNMGNVIDFCVLKDGDFGGIKTAQGSSVSPAGNTFSGSDYHFYNDGELYLSYYYNASATGQTPDITKLYRTSRISTTNSNSCLSHYGLVSKSSQELEELEDDFLSAREAYFNLMRIYMSRLDGGNTPAEVAELVSATPSDAQRLRTKLLGLSPYLSQEVLTTTADRDDVFSNPVLFEILASNPDELRKDTLISYLEQRNPPLPDYMIGMLQQIALGATPRTILTAQMTQYWHDGCFAAGDIVRSILNDSVADPQQLRSWLGNMGEIAADRMAIASYMQEGDFESAFELAALLPNLYELDENGYRDHSDYMRLLGLFRILHTSGRTTAQMTENELGMVDSIADRGCGFSKSMAEVLRKCTTRGQRTEEYACPELPTTRGTRDNAGINESDNKGFSVKVAPNPTKDKVKIDYILPEDAIEAVLEIVNILGVKVITETLRDRNGSKNIYIGNFPAGTYFLRIIMEDGTTYSDKIVKQ